MKPFRIFVAAVLLALIPGASAQAQDKIEKPDLVLGVGGKSSLYYLPLTLAERAGLFQGTGAERHHHRFRRRLEIAAVADRRFRRCGPPAPTNTPSGCRSKGQDIAAVIELGRFPGMVLAVRKDKAAQVKSFGDLKGMKIGVSAPGSSTNFFVNALIARDGVKPMKYRSLAVGTGLSRGRGGEEGRDRRHRQSRSGHDQARPGRRHRHTRGLAHRRRQHEAVRRQ